MNATFHFKDQLQASWETARQYLSDGIDLLGSSIAAGFYKEHKQDDTHGVVTADSLTSRAGLYERSRTVAIGEWQDVTGYALSQFTAATGTWTVTDVVSYRWMRLGNTIFITLLISNTSSTTSAPTANVYVPLPVGLVVKAKNANADKRMFVGGGQINDGALNPVLPFVQSGDTVMTITKPSAANIAAAGVGIQAFLMFEVEP